MSSTLDDAREFWDRSFGEVEPAVREAPPGRDLSDIVSRLRASSAVSVLDVGCGLGHWSVALARAGFKIVAVDVSSEAVGIVRDRARRQGLPISVAVCAAQELSQLGTDFDAVVCNSVLDHMRPPDAEEAAASMVQVLKASGLAYVSFDGPDETAGGLEVPLDYMVHPDGAREYISGSRRGMIWRFYADEEIRRLFRSLEEIEFAVAAGGERRAWFRRPGLVQAGV